MASRRSAIAPDVAEFTNDWQRLQNQKQRMRGGVESRMICNLAMRFGEQYVTQARDSVLTRPIGKDAELNRLSLVFNLIKKARNRKIGRLWSIANEFRASPDIIDPKAFDQATVINKLIKGLNKRLRERSQHWLRLSWLVDTGVVMEHIPWIEEASGEQEPVPQYDEQGELLWRDAQNPDQKALLPQSAVEQMVEQGATQERFTTAEKLQQVGDVGSQIVSGLNFFIDNSVPTIAQLGPDQACYIAEVKTVGFIRETFGNDVAAQIEANVGSDLSIVKTRLLDRGPSVANINLRDLMPAIQGSRGPEDPPMCIMLTRYQPPCANWPNGRRSLLVPRQVMLEDEDVDYGEVPVVDFHYEAPTTNFWTGDYITDLVAPQKFLNKRLSQAGEYANASLYEVLLLGGELGRDDIPTDLPGIVKGGIDDTGNPRVKVLQHQEMGQWFLEVTKLVVELMGSMSSSDLTDHRQFPGQLRGPMALPMLQEILDSEDGPLYMHLGEQLARVHQQRINRVKQFYPPIRTLHFTGSGKKDEVLVFHKEAILKAGTSFTVSVDPGSLLPEFSALREARLIERLSGPLAGLYTNKRTGKLDFSRIASELRFGDADDTDRESQYRDLAQHLIARLWQGEALPPEIPYAFWDHDAMLDELEASMATTEFLEASSEVKQNFVSLYEKHRQFLAAIQQAQMDSVQNQMMQGVIAQTSQQVAAKVAAETTDAALGQIRTQAAMAKTNPPVDQVAAAFGRVPPAGQ